jgi:hypothetical protein
MPKQEEKKAKQDNDMDGHTEKKDDSHEEVVTNATIGGAWKNKAKAQQLTQQFFAILAVLDITGSSSISSSGILLFNINLDDDFVENNFKILGTVLLIFAGYIFIDGLTKSMNVFNAQSLPSLADLLLDWLIDLLSFIVIVPILSAGGGDLNYLLLSVVLAETAIVLFVTQKIGRKKIRIALTIFIISTVIFGFVLAFYIAEQVKDELVTGNGTSFADGDHRGEELRTPAGLKEAALAMTCFILFVFFSIGGYCATIHYSSHLGKMTFLGPKASKIFDYVFSSWLAIPLFFIVITISKCIELTQWLFKSLLDMYNGLKDSEISTDGTIEFVCIEDAEDEEDQKLHRDNNVVPGPDSSTI